MQKDQTLKYIISISIFGTIGIFLHYINASSEFVVMCRGILGSLFILGVILVRKEKIDFKNIKDNLLILILSGIFLGLNWVFLFIGYEYSVSLASLCNYLAPIIVLIITDIMSKKPIKFIQIICIILSFVGILF